MYGEPYERFMEFMDGIVDSLSDSSDVARAQIKKTIREMFAKDRDYWEQSRDRAVHCDV